MTTERKLKVGITQGDINGIGYETILKTLADERITELCTPVIYGSAKIANYYRKALDMAPLQNVVTHAAAEDARDGEITFVDVEMPADLKVEPGQSTTAAGQAAFAALEKAVADVMEGRIDVLVTAPINKHNIQSETFSFPGHTEYLQAAAASDEESGDSPQALMILMNDRIRVALVTSHIPVSRIAETITRKLVADKIRAFDGSLRRDFAIERPRIAVLALNPHAGDDGLLGSEDTEIIAPAIAEVSEGCRITAFGPYPADGFFGSGAFRRFDGVLAMYHDQGLAPFKALCMDDGVNFTAGLPFVRTSPDHGTGYDIAGKGEANPDSLRAAIYAAIDIYRRRLTHAEITSNPLRKIYHEKNKHDNVVLDLTKSDD
ncbi:MAG: 4-hydroxythreonine-4-phosphate dehydrogenase PdxA [Paramuribaculum sp.]|nr:4-hydroxythreonine-4-phosphate dehydrogenase PdxA [Paramuribaculum sp.]